MSTTEQLVDFTLSYGDIDDVVKVGHGHEIMFMADGVVRFAHDCKTLPGDGRQARFAPDLRDHTIVTREPLTIVASIACGDCHVHGWVTNGKWVNA